MRRLGLLATVLAVLGCALAGVALAQGPWHTQSAHDNRLSVLFPVVPVYSTKEAKTASGTSYTMHQYSAEVGERAFIVLYATYPSDVDVSNPRKNLEGYVDGSAKSLDGGKWSSVSWVTHQGLPAVDAVGRQGAFEFRSVATIKGSQLVGMVYGGAPGSSNSEEANRFFRSLRVW